MRVNLYVVLSSSCERCAAHLDLLYAGVPLVHLLHSEEQNIIELIDVSLQDRLKPEDPPSPWYHFAIDYVSIALITVENVQTHFQQTTVAGD